MSRMRYADLGGTEEAIAGACCSRQAGYAHDKANRMTTLANKTQGYDPASNLTLGYSGDRCTPFGSGAWAKRRALRPGPAASLNPRGRPPKEPVKWNVPYIPCYQEIKKRSC